MDALSKNREQPIGRFFLNVWHVKRKHCLFGFFACVIFVTITLRTNPMAYQASIRMFAQMSRKGQSNTGTVGIPEMERITFIASQEELLTSYPLYLKVRRNYTDSDWPSSTDSEDKKDDQKSFSTENLSSKLSKLIFGKDYADETSEWNDKEYTKFVKNLSFEQKPSSGTFIITYSDSNPRRAIAITKLIAEGLVELNYDIVNKKKGNLIQYLETKKEEAQQKVEESKNKIARFLVINDYSENQAYIDAKIKQYTQITDQYNQNLIEKEAESIGLELMRQYVLDNTEALKKTFKGGLAQTFQSLSAELTQLESAKLKRESGYGKESQYYDESIARVKDKLDKIIQAGIPINLDDKNKIINELQQLQLQREITLAGKIKKLEFTKTLKEKYEMEIKRFPELQATLSNYLFEHQQNVKMLQLISESLVTTSIQGDSELTQLFSIQEPMILNPTLKKGLKLFLSVFVLSILFLVSYGMFHLIRGTIFSKHDLIVPDVPKHYFLGSIPRLAHFTEGKLSRHFSGNDAILKDAQTLKHHLAIQDNNKGTVVQFWSEADASGKSITTFAMALALKDLGHTTLVLDCDFRGNGSLLNYASQEKNRRHISVLKSLSEVIEILEFGSNGQLSEPDIKQFIQSKVTITTPILKKTNQKEAYRYFDIQFYSDILILKKHFDFILLDAPPLSVGQGLLTSPYADAIVLCCPEGNMTQGSYSEILRYIDSYCGDKTKILSLITMSQLKINSEAMEIGSRDRTLSRKLKMAS